MHFAPAFQLCEKWVMPDTAPDSSAVIHAAFLLEGSGRTITFLPPAHGFIPRNGTVGTSQGDMPYRGPFYIRRPDRRPLLSILVPDDPASLGLQPGDAITFHGAG